MVWILSPSDSTDMYKGGAKGRKTRSSDTPFEDPKQCGLRARGAPASYLHAMDFDSLRIFVRVAELGSFTRAAEQLAISKARASLRVSELERELGTQLLRRSTRAVTLTPDGEILLARATRLVADADEVGAMFHSQKTIRGRLRVDLPAALARDVVIPRLAEFLAAHPQIELVVSTTDRRVEVVREGFDCVLRIGALADSGLVAKRVGALAMVNLASPSYLERHGVPRTLADLDRHYVVHYSPGLAGEPPSFEYALRGRTAERPMKSLVTVTTTDAYLAACAAGLGIVQVPRFGTGSSLDGGAFVEILADLRPPPMPVSLVHAHGSNVPRRVRAFMAWMSRLLEPVLA
jgi:DNA-binding transcriptional LysR family regulator